jgi:hypothetical protein
VEPGIQCRYIAKLDDHDPIRESSTNSLERKICARPICNAAADTESELVLTEKVHIVVNSLPAADTIFWILVSPNASDLASSVVDQQGRQHFSSYAKEDRVEVMKARRGLKLANTEAFMDVLSMRAGEHWERRLEEEIERRIGIPAIAMRYQLDEPCPVGTPRKAPTLASCLCKEFAR